MSKYIKKKLPKDTPKYFCTAPWVSSSVRIESSDIKGCSRVPYEVITEEKLKEHGVDYIFNNQRLQEERRKKLAGEKDVESCNFCYTLEDNQAWSMRQDLLDSFNDDIPQILEEKPINVKAPKSLALLIDTFCPLKCVYCGPRSSSSWEADIKKNGNFKSWKHNIPAPENREYFAEYFWEWFDKNIKDIETLTILGGEPTLQPKFYEIVDKIIEISKHRTEIFRLDVDTNGDTLSHLMPKVIEMLQKLNDADNVKTNFVFSMESFGKRAEYIRYGLSWERFDNNVKMILDQNFDNLVGIGFQTTLNSLCISSLPLFIKYAIDLEDKYGKEFYWHRNVVNNPRFQSPFILTPDFAKYIEQTLNLIKDRPHMSHMFELYESILTGLNGNKNRDNLRANWYRFINEHDERRGTNFLETFPEMKTFYNNCKWIDDNTKPTWKERTNWL